MQNTLTAVPLATEGDYNITDEAGRLVGFIYADGDVYEAELEGGSRYCATVADCLVFAGLLRCGAWADVAAGRVPAPIRRVR